MEKIKKYWLKEYGYIPTDNEILNAYKTGSLVLTDKTENELIRHLESKN